MDIKLRTTLVAAILALSACSTPAKDGVIRYANDDVSSGDHLVDNGVQRAQTKLAEAAIATSDSLGQLAAMEKVSTPRTKLTQPLDGDRIGLGGLASVDWTGPVEPLVSKLATAGHYKFRVVGKNPAIPVLVAVYAANMPLADILRDANLQAGKKADVMVYPSHRVIELRYR